MKSSFTTIKESNKCPEMEGTGESHNICKLWKFLEQKKRPNLDPMVLSGIYGCSVTTVKKVTELVAGYYELYQLYSFPYAIKTQEWIDKKINKKQMNLRDLQRIILSTHIYDKTILEILDYVRLEGEDSWVSLQKWKLSAFFSFYNNQDIPPVPWNFSHEGSFYKPHILLSGPYHDFYYQLKEEYKQTFQNTVLLGLKKGAPRVRKAMLDQASLKTFEALTDEKYKTMDIELDTLILKDKNGFSNRYPIGRKDLIIQIERTVKELFSGQGKKLDKYFKPYFPSISSNIEDSRSQMGSVGTFYRDFRSEKIKMVKEESRFVSKSEDNVTYQILKKKYFGRTESGIDIGQEKCDLYGHRSEFFGDYGKEEDELLQWKRDFSDEQAEESTLIIADPTELIRLYKEDYFNWFEKAHYDCMNLDSNYAEIVALAEPLKVRCITKSSPKVQLVLKPIQKWLHTTLRKLHIFKLIGSPIDESYINQHFMGLPENNEIVSGDYKAATDNLKSWASEAAGTAIFKIIAEEFETDASYPKNFIRRLKDIFISSLTKHVFLHPNGGIMKHQTNGQLMGEISSFPILCIVNAAMCRFSKEIAEKRPYKLKDNVSKEVLINLRYPPSTQTMCLGINGDDCIFDGPIGRIRPAWEFITKMVGLESSIGKTYFSRNMCTVNSRVFRREKDSDSWVESKFINFGLLYGRKKSVVIEDDDEKSLKKKSGKQVDDKIPVHKMGQFLRDLKKTTPPPLWKAVKSRFIYYNMNRLENTYLSWYLPEWCGGLGLPNDGELSDTDRIIAAVIKQNYREFKPVPMTDAPEWLMHQLVIKELPHNSMTFSTQFKYKEKTYDIEKSWNELYSFFTYSLLYSKEAEALINNVDQERSIKRAIRHNENVLQRAYKIARNANIAPMSDSDLETEVKRSFLPCLVVNKPMIQSCQGYLPRWIE